MRSSLSGAIAWALTIAGSAGTLADAWGLVGRTTNGGAIGVGMGRALAIIEMA